MSEVSVSKNRVGKRKTYDFIFSNFRDDLAVLKELNHKLADSIQYRV